MLIPVGAPAHVLSPGLQSLAVRAHARRSAEVPWSAPGRRGRLCCREGQVGDEVGRTEPDRAGVAHHPPSSTPVLTGWGPVVRHAATSERRPSPSRPPRRRRAELRVRAAVTRLCAACTLRRRLMPPACASTLRPTETRGTYHECPTGANKTTRSNATRVSPPASNFAVTDSTSR